MRIGWAAYSALRRDLLAPIGSCDQQIVAINGLRHLSGNPIHWLPLKCLTPDCQYPSHSALQDEKDAHNNIIHYEDSLLPIMQYVNKAPTEGRADWLYQNRPPKPGKNFDYPELDILIIEATGQMGGAYGINEVALSCYEKNNNIGFVVFDQDLAGTTIIAKLKKWLPNYLERIVLASHYFSRKKYAQVIAFSPHLDYAEREPNFDHDYLECAYVGNDYKRREPMLNFLKGPRTHHFGRLKDDFKEEFRNQGVNLHGPFIPSEKCQIEDIYAYYGSAINLAREDAMATSLIPCRPSEVARAGSILFTDSGIAVGKALGGEWCQVDTNENLLAKLDVLTVPEYRQFWQDIVYYQRDTINYYLNKERFIDSLWFACCELVKGPVQISLFHHPYDDLQKLAGIQMRNT